MKSRPILPTRVGIAISGGLDAEDEYGAGGLLRVTSLNHDPVVAESAIGRVEKYSSNSLRISGLEILSVEAQMLRMSMEQVAGYESHH